jgi:hypothetical protein
MYGDGGEDEGGAGGLLGGLAEHGGDVPVCRTLAPHGILLHHLCCSLQLTLLSSILSHPVLEGKPNANHVCARISNSRTQQLHNRTSSHSA